MYGSFQKLRQFVRKATESIYPAAPLPELSEEEIQEVDKLVFLDILRAAVNIKCMIVEQLGFITKGEHCLSLTQSIG